MIKLAVYNEKDKSKWTKDGRHWYFRTPYRDSKGKKDIRSQKDLAPEKKLRQRN